MAHEPYRQRKSRTGLVIGLLVAVIVILLVFILVILVVQPRFQGYVVNQQVAAQQMVIATMIQSLNQNGYVTISDAEGQSIVLVPYQNPNQANTQA